MHFWGKLVGAGLGFLFGGIIGAMIGAFVGHQFDRGLQNLRLPGGPGLDVGATQRVFFESAFSVMGAMAKADGQVSAEEIELAEAAMRHMSLNSEQRRAAIGHFNRGKQASFDLDAALADLSQHIWRRPLLKRMFIELQLQAAYADGSLHAGEFAVLLRIAETLSISRADLERMAAAVAARMGAAGPSGAAPSAASTLSADYALLGVSAEASDSDLKRAYRKLMSEHHPDKLMAKGLPESMIKLANEKTAAISAAYERIETARKR